jgi:predicted molibdopterin-dependent oxidoreductase YjgC
MFRRIPLPENERRAIVEIHVDEQRIATYEGEPLAIALLNANIVPFRHTPISGQPRAPLCLMGVCFDCLVEVDGMKNVQSCMVSVKAGMRVRLPSNGVCDAGDAQ